MTHRIDQSVNREGVRLLFQGRLDRPALENLTALCDAGLRRGERVAVVFGAGTEVEPALVDEVLQIQGIELSAESPFLARLIEAGTDEEAR